ncbi:MAG: hypothetical protein ACLTAF_15430 [Blautia coccoides]
MGSFIEAPAFYGNLTGEENLIIRKILGLQSSVSDALELVGLTSTGNALPSPRYETRLGLASALIGRRLFYSWTNR